VEGSRRKDHGRGSPAGGPEDIHQAKGCAPGGGPEDRNGELRYLAQERESLGNQVQEEGALGVRGQATRHGELEPAGTRGTKAERDDGGTRVTGAWGTRANRETEN